MARKQRVDLAGSFHHVMVRGVDRQPIFRSERDFRRYLDSMEEALRFGWVRIEARCLLMNHLHLLIESLTGEMWRYMHRVNSNFAARFNRIHNRVGHLFQGRFKSKILLSNEAVFEVGRYIHMNPVQAGIVRDPRDYRWSSMKGLYLNRPEPLSGNRRLRSPFSGPDGAEDFFRFTTARSEFIETADGWLDQEGLYETENSPSASPANASVGVVRTDEVFERVLRVVSAEFGIPIDRLINAWRDRHAGYAKGVTAAILSMSSPLTSAEIAERLRYRSPGGVRQAVQRIREVASRDLSLRKFINSFV